jgi:hypothetical protein
MVERLSDTLDKPVTFIVHGGDIWAHPKHVRPVFRDLAHLIRNALDHGIEDLADRGDKPAIARVELRITDTGKEICIEVVDDGRESTAIWAYSQPLPWASLTAKTSKPSTSISGKNWCSKTACPLP